VSLTSWIRNLFSRPERPKEVALGRNDLCWCGSRKKYKKCHLPKDAAEQREANYAALAAARTRKAGGGIVPGGTNKKASARPPENEAATNANRR
jgi:SEC-C motif